VRLDLVEEGHQLALDPLVAVAVVGPGQTLTPCGRCRQVLSELAQLGSTDPQVWCGEGGAEMRLSELLPHAFGPDSLA
jgi:cytidine deaminase